MRVVIIGSPDPVLLRALQMCGADEIEVTLPEVTIEQAPGEERTPFAKLDDVVTTATSPGNAFANDYLLGMANGLLLAKAVVTDTDVEYLSMPKKSTRGHKVGDPVRYDREGHEPVYGRVVDLHNGHAVVKFDGADALNVMVGTTMDNLKVIDEPQPEQAAPKDVASEDFHVSVTDVIRGLINSNDEGEVQAIVTVTLGSGGNVVVASSEGTPLTLNLLAQGIKVADGTYDAADDDTPERIRSDD